MHYVYVCVWVCVHVWVKVKIRAWCWVFSSIARLLSPFPPPTPNPTPRPETGLSQHLKLSHMGTMNGRWAPCVPELDVCLHMLPFCRSWGSKLRSARLCSRHYTDCAIPAALNPEHGLPYSDPFAEWSKLCSSEGRLDPRLWQDSHNSGVGAKGGSLYLSSRSVLAAGSLFN